MTDTWEFTEKRFILCEGPHDKEFVESLIKERDLGPFQVMASYDCSGFGGVDGFGLSIESFPPIAGFDDLIGIAIITDNDNSDSITKLETKLKNHGYVPTVPRARGTIANKPIILVPLPDNENCGDLEKMCLPALYAKWPGSETCMGKYLQCTGALSWRKTQQLSKAKVRCIISAYHESDPYKGLGYFFKENKSLTRHKCFDYLANVLDKFDDIINQTKVHENQSLL